MKKGILLILIIILLSFVNSSLWSEQETYISKTIVTIPWGDSNGQVPLYEEKVEMNDGSMKTYKYAMLYDLKTNSKGNIYLLIRSERVDKYSPTGDYLKTIPVLVNNNTSIVVKIAIDKNDSLYAYIEDKEKTNKHPYKSKLLKLNDNGKILYNYSLPESNKTFFGDLRIFDDEVTLGDRKVKGIGPKAEVIKPEIQQSSRPEEIMNVKGLRYEAHPTGWTDSLKGVYVKDSNDNVISKFEVIQPLNIERTPDIIKLLKIDKNGNIFIAPGFYTTAIKPDPRELLEIQKYNKTGNLLTRIFLPKTSEWDEITSGVFWPPCIDDDGNIYYFNASESGMKIIKAFIQN